MHRCSRQIGSRWLLYFLLLVPFSGWGQSFNFMNYNIGDGLVHDKVIDLCEDGYGNIWVATLGGGLSKFNGVGFENVTIKEGLSSNYVRAVLVDSRGRVWAATAEGISMYDGSSFHNFMVDAHEDNNSVQALYEDRDGKIWFSAFGGHLGRIDPDLMDMEFYSFPRASLNDNIIQITQDNSGKMWMVSSIQGLLSFDNNEFEIAVANKDIGGYILTAYNYRDTLWLGTNRGIFYYNVTDPEPRVKAIPALNNIFIKKIRVFGENNIWAVTSSGIFNYVDGELREFRAEEGFTDVAVNTLFVDREGSIWFGTDGEGLYTLSSEIFVKYGEDHGLPGETVTTLTRGGDGNLWIGTYGGGIVSFDGNEFKVYGKEQGVSNAYISASVTDNDGNMWFGTYSSGLIRYDGTTFEDIGEREGLRLMGIRYLFKDSRGNIWIGTGEGLARWDGNEFMHITTEDGLYDDIIWSISEPSPGRIMVVTREGFNFVEDDSISSGYYEADIFSKRINTAVEDNKGNLWIGYSGHGISRVDSETGEVLHLSDQEGLNSNLIYNLIIDTTSGDLIVGTERGVDRIFLDSVYNVIRIKNYQHIEGFVDLQTQPHAFYQDYEGNIWFGARKNLFKYQPGKINLNKAEPIVYISGVRLYYNEVDWSQFADSVSTWYDIPENPRLPHQNNNMVIDFFGNSLRNPQEVRYKFRLIGLNEEWSPVSETAQASFTNLSPGDYRFEVLASNSDGIWSQAPATFEFSIIPPFWQRPWFFGVIIIYFILMITLYNNYRVRSNLNKILTIEKIRQEELTKVRKRMARDFHDNMGNQIASITMYANLISLKLQNRTDEIDHLLEDIEKHTKSLFTGTKDFIWSMDPDTDDLDKVYTYIKDFGEELFENSSITFYADVQGKLPASAPLPSGWNRQIILIFKEAMTNTLKHSGADEVHLDVEPKPRGFVITLKDNGNGIPSVLKGKGYGLKNMKSRAVQIGCTLEIEPLTKQKGTVIRFIAEIPRVKKNGAIKKFLQHKTTL